MSTYHYHIVRMENGPAIEICDTQTGRAVDFKPLFPRDASDDIDHVARVAFTDWLYDELTPQVEPTRIVELIGLAFIAAIVAVACFL